MAEFLNIASLIPTTDIVQVSPYLAKVPCPLSYLLLSAVV